MQPQKSANFILQPTIQFWGSIILSHTMSYANGYNSEIRWPNNSKARKCSQQFGMRFAFGFWEHQVSLGYLSPAHLMPFPVPKGSLSPESPSSNDDRPATGPQDSWLCETWVGFNHAALKWTHGILKDPAKYWYPLVNKNSYGKSPFSIGKSTINDHFNSYISHYQSVNAINSH